MLKKLWLDEGGVVLSTELILVMVILVIGLVTGLTALKTAVVLKLADVAGAVAQIDTSYGFTGSTYDASTASSLTSAAYTNGSEYQGAPTAGDDASDVGVAALNVVTTLSHSEDITEVDEQ